MTNTSTAPADFYADLEALRPTMVDVAKIAKALFGAPTADVAILADGMVWHASKGAATSRRAPGTELIVARKSLLWIKDLLDHDEPDTRLVIGAYPKLRFFAGAPILFANGDCVGALTVYDEYPRSFDPRLSRRFSDLAGIVARDFERIKAVRESAEAREHAARQEERFRIAVEGAGLHVYEIDYVNKTMFKAGAEGAFFDTPQTYSDLAREPWRVIDRKDWPEAAKAWHKANVLQRPWQLEHRIPQRDGSEVWSSTTCKLIKDDAGRPLRLIGANQDITARKRAEAELAESLRTATQALEAKRSLLGSILEAKEPDRDSLAEFAPAPSANEPRVNVRNRLTGLLAEIDLHDKSIADAVAILKSSRQAADAANASKSQFVANMSHELRTPLNAIIGYAEILLEDPSFTLPPQASNDVERIHRAARTLLGLINEILDLAKIEAGKLDIMPGDVDVSALCLSLIETVQHAATKNGNQITCDLSAKLGYARTDHARLSQCLLNLLSNACKFTQDGIVSLSASREIDAGGDMLRFVVRDSGIGLTDEQLALLFRPFVQADVTVTRKFGGTGLGLAITRELAQLLGGDVSVQSEAGKGSVFTLLVRADLEDTTECSTDARCA